MCHSTTRTEHDSHSTHAFLPLPPRLQVYLAKWRETLVAVKILMNTGVDIEDADDAERALTLSNPVLVDLEKVGSDRGAGVGSDRVVKYVGGGI